MVAGNEANLQLLELAVHYLGELAEEFVFLGGCVTGILITDKASPPIRGTMDVDVIARVLSKAEYYALAQELRSRGFSKDRSDDAPVCRWNRAPLILDVMPVEASVLGFGNCWYAQAMEQAERHVLPGNRSIRVVSPVFFLLTKLEAFHGRGEGDYHLSHDLEDIVAVIDGRPMIVDEIRQSSEELRSALSDYFKPLLNDPRFLDALYGHMPTHAASQARVPLVVDRMRQMVR